ncbi:MAG: RNA polymerase sigma factor [Pseudobacteriovorax sp.]|nr:RNA polymerase sigma factor [Pseudobacteriovorax sp.]
MLVLHETAGIQGKLLKLSRKKFSKIYHENYNYLSFVAKKMGLNEQDSDDVIQETFMKFYKYWNNEDYSKVRSFLITILRNAAIDSHRKAYRKKECCEGNEIEGAVSAENLWVNDPDVHLNRALVSKIIEDIARKDGKNECFKMFYLDGLSLKEISKRTNIPIGTIGTRLSKLRLVFKKHYSKEVKNV